MPTTTPTGERVIQICSFGLSDRQYLAFDPSIEFGIVAEPAIAEIDFAESLGQGLALFFRDNARKTLAVAVHEIPPAAEVPRSTPVKRDQARWALAADSRADWTSSPVADGTFAITSSVAGL